MRGHHMRNQNHRGSGGSNMLLPVDQSSTQSGVKLTGNSNMILGPRQIVNHIQTIVRNKNSTSNKVNSPYANPDDL